LGYNVEDGIGGPRLFSSISYAEQGKMYVYQPNDMNGNLGAVYSYTLGKRNFLGALKINK